MAIWSRDDDPVMRPVSSKSTLLVLHAVRLLGFADEGRVAARFALDRGQVAESLKDFEAFAWVQRSRFAGTGGWSLPTRVGRRTMPSSRPSSTPPVPDRS